MCVFVDYPAPGVHTTLIAKYFFMIPKLWAMRLCPLNAQGLKNIYMIDFDITNGYFSLAPHSTKQLHGNLAGPHVKLRVTH